MWALTALMTFAFGLLLHHPVTPARPPQYRLAGGLQEMRVSTSKTIAMVFIGTYSPATLSAYLEPHSSLQRTASVAP